MSSELLLLSLDPSILLLLVSSSRPPIRPLDGAPLGLRVRPRSSGLVLFKAWFCVLVESVLFLGKSSTSVDRNPEWALPSAERSDVLSYVAAADWFSVDARWFEDEAEDAGAEGPVYADDRPGGGRRYSRTFGLTTWCILAFLTH